MIEYTYWIKIKQYVTHVDDNVKFTSTVVQFTQWHSFWPRANYLFRNIPNIICVVQIHILNNGKIMLRSIVCITRDSIGGVSDKEEKFIY